MVPRLKSPKGQVFENDSTFLNALGAKAALQSSSWVPRSPGLQEKLRAKGRARGSDLISKAEASLHLAEHPCIHPLRKASLSPPHRAGVIAN